MLKFLAAGFKILKRNQTHILALAAFVTQNSSSPWFTLTVLPYLIHVSKRSVPTAYIAQVFPPLATGHAVQSLLSTWGLLDSPLKVMGSQALFSSLLAGLVTFLPLSWDMIPSYGASEYQWTLSEIMGFGLWWATIWAGVEQFSPFGRYGIPGFPGRGIPSLTWLSRLIGPTGMDVIAGSTAYSLSLLADRVDATTIEKLPISTAGVPDTVGIRETLTVAILAL